MDIREYLTGLEGRTWHAKDTAWVMNKMRQIDKLAQDAYDARWLVNAAWNAQAIAEWEERNT